MDKMLELVRSEVTASFDFNTDPSAGVVSEIFKSLVNDFTPLTADNTSVVNSGTTIIVKSFICNHTSVMEKCKKLAELLDWQFYFNPDDQRVHFEPKGIINSGVTLSQGQNVLKPILWTFNTKETANDLTAQGARTPPNDKK